MKGLQILLFFLLEFEVFINVLVGLECFISNPFDVKSAHKMHIQLLYWILLCYSKHTCIFVLVFVANYRVYFKLIIKYIVCKDRSYHPSSTKTI